MAEQDTSYFWRKLLGLDRPAQNISLEKYKSWHRFLRPAFYSILNLLMRYYFPEKVFGLENLPGRAPYIIAANHASAIDFAVVAWAMGRRREELYPIATKLFYDNLFTRFWMKVGSNVIRIDTVDDYFPALRMAVNILNAGGSVYINPEGMRSTAGDILPFRAGVGVVAVETGVPIVPVYLHNTWRVLPTGALFPVRVPVSVVFGRPLSMEPYRQKLLKIPTYEVYKEVTADLRAIVLELRSKISK